MMKIKGVKKITGQKTHGAQPETEEEGNWLRDGMFKFVLGEVVMVNSVVPEGWQWAAGQGLGREPVSNR